MKLFSWMHNKLNGRQANNCNANISATTKNQTPQLVAPKEEFSDWPQGILSIGTLFNKSSNNDTKDHQDKTTPIIDFTLEEVKELQKELSALLASNDVNCLSSLDAEKLAKIAQSSPPDRVEGGGDDDDHDEDDDDDHGEGSDHRDRVDQHSNSRDIVPNKAKDLYLSRKKSMSFLLKKMFVCGVGGLSPSPSLRDPTISARKTSITKILRAMLRKKIYPQNSNCQTMSRSKKYLGNGQMIENNNYEDRDEDEGDDDDELDDEGNTISKWDKSDTEYIVLEI